MFEWLQLLFQFVVDHDKEIAAAILAIGGWSTGFLGFIYRGVLAKALDWLGKKGVKETQKPIDKEIIKEGDKLETQPVSDQVEKDRQDNLLDLISGGKKP